MFNARGRDCVGRQRCRYHLVNRLAACSDGHASHSIRTRSTPGTHTLAHTHRSLVNVHVTFSNSNYNAHISHSLQISVKDATAYAAQAAAQYPQYANLFQSSIMGSGLPQTASSAGSWLSMLRPSQVSFNHTQTQFSRNRLAHLAICAIRYHHHVLCYTVLYFFLSFFTNLMCNSVFNHNYTYVLQYFNTQGGRRSSLTSRLRNIMSAIFRREQSSPYLAQGSSLSYALRQPPLGFGLGAGALGGAGLASGLTSGLVGNSFGSSASNAALLQAASAYQPLVIPSANSQGNSGIQSNSAYWPSASQAAQVKRHSRLTVSSLKY